MVSNELYPELYHHGFETRKSAEYQLFEKQFAVLFESIQDPVTLSTRLFEDDGEPTRTTIRPELQKIKLLNAVKRQIMLDPRNFYKFLDELEMDNRTLYLGRMLRHRLSMRSASTPGE